ncbi:DNA-(apurinic or apyrimidinic site) lyase [Bertholletia excelsa]
MVNLAERKRKNTKPGAEAAATTTIAADSDKKRPRRVKRTRPKCEGEKEEAAAVGGDIEDLGFRRDEALVIRASLLEWYDRNQRDLPWRRISSNGGDGDEDEDGSERRAYAVWVSEVMLQQTRVQTVIDYFNRWMRKWPTLCHLSRASVEEVNEMWAGLGYYRRARFLLEGAKMIIDGGGIFPKTVSELRKVRGIGDYTAGAIASIAFKEPVPVVDGNVIRVVARLKAIAANPKESATIKNFWKLAGQLVDPSRPGDFNQALMELGATVCTPLNPTCAACPLSAYCSALSLSKHGSVAVTDYPTRVVKTKQRHDFSAVSVVEIIEGLDSDGRFLLVKRPDEGLLAGLWEFPSVLLEKESDLDTRRNAIDQYLRKSFNLDFKKSCSVVLREEIGEYVHVFSHIRLKMHVELLIVHLKGGKHILHGKHESKTIAWKSVDSTDLSNMGLSSGVRKVYSMIQKFKQNGSKPILPKARNKKAL